MPRFVLLEHRWNGVHWDFMLETTPGGSLRTWAIDAPIAAIAPNVVLPARALGDHRAAYLDYEGEVSGDRGTVRRVDRGDYEAEVLVDDLVRIRIAGAQLVGVVELRKTAEARGLGWTFRLGLGNFD